LDRLGESLAMREAVSIIGDIDEAGWRAIRSIVVTVGVSSVEGLKPMVAVEHDTVGSVRAADTIAAFGSPSVSRLAPLVADPRWFAQRAAARILGEIGSPEAVPLLQPLLRKSDPRAARSAVAALGRIDDPAAARAIHTALRAATGPVRGAIVNALVADRDPRVVPMLARVLTESDPFGRDYDIVMETLDALGTVGSEQAVPTLTTVSRQRRWLRRRRLKAIKEKAIDAIVRIGGDGASAALGEAAKTGDRMLKKIVASRST
jgi:HEAT repeat protein